MKPEDIPTYKKVLSSFERSVIGQLGWAFSDSNTEKFDEEFNHKLYDKKNIPRVIDQPVDFCI